MSDWTEPELSREEVRQRTARGAVSAFGRHTLVRLLAFFSTLVLARLIGPDSFGLFVSANFVLGCLQALVVGGVTSALVRRREAVSVGDYYTALTIQQGVAVLAITAVFFAAPSIAAAYGLPPEDGWVFFVISTGLLLASLRSIPQAVLQRSLRQDQIAASEIIEYIVYAGSAIVFAYLGWNVWALVAATILRHLSASLVLHWIARPPTGISLDLARAKRLLVTAVPLQAVILVDLSQRAMVPLVIGLVFGLTSVGFVAMANTILEALILQPLVMIASLQLRLFARIQDEPERIRNLLADCYTAGATVVLPIAGLVAVYGPDLLPHLLSERWAGVGDIVRWLFFALALQVVMVPTGQAAKAIGEIRAPLYGGIANVAVQLAILFFAGPYLGLLSYPLAVACGNALTLTVVAHRVGRRVGGLPLRVLIPNLVAAGAAAAVWTGFEVYSDGLVVTGIGVALGGLVYVVLMIALAGQKVGKLVRFVSAVSARAAMVEPLAKFVEDWSIESIRAGRGSRPRRTKRRKDKT